MFVIVAAILVSILWVLILLNLWIDWFRERGRRAQRSPRAQMGRAGSCGPFELKRVHRFMSGDP